MSSNLIAKRYARGFLKLLEAEGEPLAENFDLKSGVIRAEVVSAHELDESEKTSIEQKLLLKLGKKLEIQFLIDKSLLAGVIVKVGHRSFDVSVQANLNELAVATQL